MFALKCDDFRYALKKNVGFKKTQFEKSKTEYK